MARTKKLRMPSRRIKTVAAAEPVKADPVSILSDRMEDIVLVLRDIRESLTQRNTLLQGTISAPVPAIKVEEIAKAVAAAPLATPAEVEAALPPKKKRGRPSKADLAARAAAAATPTAEQVLETASEGEMEEVGAPVEICACNVRADLPPHLHGHDCPVYNKPAPKAEVVAPAPKVEVVTAPPSLDDVRGVAIAYAGKHGKDGLAAVLAKYSADKLSSVTEDKRAALMAELSAGV